MPIKIPNNLPAVETLRRENIFVMAEQEAATQDIRPLQILLVNLMPKKIQTETQLSRLLGNTPLQIELELIAPKSHEPTNTPPEHLHTFYKTFDDVKDRSFDGCIITGAPVELLPFEEVDYWQELCGIMEWTKTHVHSTFHICWGAQAGLYYHYGIQKRQLPEKMFGVFRHSVEYKQSILFRGFDDQFYVPHSRHTTVLRSDVEAVPELRILATTMSPACTFRSIPPQVPVRIKVSAPHLTSSSIAMEAEGPPMPVEQAVTFSPSSVPVQTVYSRFWATCLASSNSAAMAGTRPGSPGRMQ